MKLNIIPGPTGSGSFDFSAYPNLSFPGYFEKDDNSFLTI
jgi:hypothetical protein